MVGESRVVGIDCGSDFITSMLSIMRISQLTQAEKRPNENEYF